MEEDMIANIIKDKGLIPRESDYLRNLNEELRGSLSAPSVTHTYSIITEFIIQWFIDRLPKNYLNYIHIEGKHIYDEYRKFKIEDVIKKRPPVMAVAPRIDLSYDRDMLDTNRFGADYLIRTARIHQSYIRDYEKNCFIGSRMEQLSIEYDIRIMVETKAQQIDLYKYLSVVFPLGHTTVENIYLDYHVPLDIMKQYAVDSGFKLTSTGDIEDPISFIRHVNKKSRLPVIYKYRTITGNLEFFMRFHDMDILIDLTDMPNHDDGDRIGMRNKRYNIDLRIGVKAPSPKFFIYYSTNRHELIGIDTINPNIVDDTIVPIHTFKLELVPKVNELGWNQYLFTEYEYDPETSNEDKVNIDLSELFKKGDIYKAIQFSIDMGVSPDNFINFKLYNGKQYLIPYKMDWESCIITMNPKKEMISANTAISVYMDTDYVHSTLIKLDRIDKTNRYKVREYDKGKKQE